MTEPDTAAKPLTAADKGWTGKIDSGIEDLFRSVWLLISFPVAVPWRFLQWRQPATLALYEARSSGRLLPPLLALGLALLLTPVLLSSIQLASQSEWHAQSVLARELERRMGGLAGELLTSAAPALLLAWLGAQLVARLQARLSGHHVDQAVNAALYLIAMMTSVLALLVLNLLSQIEVRGSSGVHRVVNPHGVFAALVGLAVLGYVGAAVHGAADAWRHAVDARWPRRAGRAAAAAALTLSLPLLLLPSSAHLIDTKATNGYALIAQWFFPADRNFADDDARADVVAQQCQLDGDAARPAVRCHLLIQGLGDAERYITDARQAWIEVVQIASDQPDAVGKLPIRLLGQLPVAFDTQPVLRPGSWLTLKPGGTTPLTLSLDRAALCEARLQGVQMLHAAAAAASAPGQHRHGGMLRLSLRAYVQDAGASTGDPDGRVVLLKQVLPVLAGAKGACPP